MESAQRRGLARLMLRWPDRRELLARRAREDTHVGELCEAYESACNAVEHWLRSPASVAQDRILEYRGLVKATEEDILSMISRS